MHKKIVYIDMDGVIVDFEMAVQQLSFEQKETYREVGYCQVPGIFASLQPIEGALDAVTQLSEIYDVYILSSPGWGNASAWSDKYEWVNTHLPFMKKRLILSSQKHLNKGDYLIDDRTANGAGEFTGELIQFGTEKYPNWNVVLTYLL
jgi:5'(3')-deoxyribonucleotidase